MTTDNREAIIAKINKLLKMTESRGATQAEAVQFALKAQQLMAEHDIEEHELGGSTDEPIESVFTSSNSTRTWRGILANAVADNFRCRTYYHWERKDGSKKRRSVYVTFYGYRHDAQAAALVFERLFSIGDELAREYVKQEKRTVEEGYKLNTKYCYDSFVVSFTEGVRAELEKQTQALMLVRPAAVDEAYQEFAQGFKKASKAKIYRGDPDAERKGFQAGRDAVRSGRLGAATDAKLLTT